VRKRRLAAELSRLRAAAGRTIDDVAVAVGVSKSTLSRVENGQIVPRLPVLRSLLGEFGVTGERAAWLEQLSRDAAKRGWWETAGGTAMRDATRMLIGLEAEADRINQFTAAMVSGLAQVPPYAEAVLASARPDLGADEIAQLVAARIQRQTRLGEVRLWLIVAEEVLMRPIGGRAVMRQQIARLLELAIDLPRTTLQVLGCEAGAHPGLSGSFTVLGFEAPEDPDVVYVEGTLWDACLEDAGDVTRYKLCFEILQATALAPADSVARLSHHLGEYS
jgi:transcriptional regulator with XRE-family HTH domain